MNTDELFDKITEVIHKIDSNNNEITWLKDHIRNISNDIEYLQLLNSRYYDSIGNLILEYKKSKES